MNRAKQQTSGQLSYKLQVHTYKPLVGIPENSLSSTRFQWACQKHHLQQIKLLHHNKKKYLYMTVKNTARDAHSR